MTRRITGSNPAVREELNQYTHHITYTVLRSESSQAGRSTRNLTEEQRLAMDAAQGSRWLDRGWGL